MGAIRDWALDKGSDIIGKKLYNYKTKSVGIGLILLGLVGILGKIFPSPELPQMEWERIIECLSGGLLALGLGHKIEKSREETRILSQTILEKHTELQRQVHSIQPQKVNIQEPILPKMAKEICPGPPRGSGGFGPKMG